MVQNTPLIKTFLACVRESMAGFADGKASASFATNDRSGSAEYRCQDAVIQFSFNTYDYELRVMVKRPPYAAASLTDIMAISGLDYRMQQCITVTDEKVMEKQVGALSRFLINERKMLCGETAEEPNVFKKVSDFYEALQRRSRDAALRQQMKRAWDSKAYAEVLAAGNDILEPLDSDRHMLLLAARKLKGPLA